jgi:hypothetical protein
MWVCDARSTNELDASRFGRIVQASRAFERTLRRVKAEHRQLDKFGLK